MRNSPGYSPEYTSEEKTAIHSNNPSFAVEAQEVTKKKEAEVHCTIM
jgi:hypothetical protein